MTVAPPSRHRYTHEPARRAAAAAGHEWYFTIADFDHALLHGTLELWSTGRGDVAAADEQGAEAEKAASGEAAGGVAAGGGAAEASSGGETEDVEECRQRVVCLHALPPP